MVNFNYRKWIEDSLRIVNKKKQEVDFILNPAQRFVLKELANRSIILKARQLGASSLALAIFTCDFILEENSYSVVVADIEENAIGFLDRVKRYIEAYQEKKGKKVYLKYNSRTELYNEVMNSIFKVGTARNTQFGRSRTITNLLLSEGAYYQDLEAIIASAVQAVVEDGRIILETTANGFNYFKTFWDNAGAKGFKKIFLNAKLEYDDAFLEAKKRELGRLFNQEYPLTPEEAFLVSGDLFFDREALMWYMANKRDFGGYNLKL